MYTIQQQYNVVPGQYAKEMAAVLPHLKSIAKELASYIVKPKVVALERNSEDHLKI